MEKPPILDNIKEKFLGSGNGHEDDEFTGGESDVLEQFRIPLSIEVPEDIMTPNDAAGVRFTYSKPKGFSPRQVEEFWNDSVESMKFYVKALEARNKHVHKLATEVDKYMTDCKNLKFQLEVFQGVGKQAVVNENGDYISESELADSERELIAKDEEIQRLKDKLLIANKDKQIAEERLAEIKTTSSAAPIPAPTASSISDEELEELQAYRDNQAALDQWEQEVGEEYSRLETELNALRLAAGSDSASAETISQLSNEIAELNSAIEGRDATIADLSSRIEGAKQKVQELHYKVEEETARADAAEQAADDAASTYEVNQQGDAGRLSQMQDSLDKANKKVASLEGEVKTLTAKVSTSESSARNADGRVKTLSGEVDTLKQELATKSEELAEAIDVAHEIEAARAELESELTEAKTAVVAPVDSGDTEEFQKHIESLDAHIDALESHISDLEASNGGYATEIAALRREVEDKESEIEDLRSRTRQVDSTSVPGYVLPPGVRPEDL